MLYINNRPNLIEIDLTEFCNYNCDNCSRVCGMSPSNKEIKIEQIEFFVKESIELNWKWKNIRIIGGEPTMHSNFLEVLKILNIYREYNLSCCIDMMTNGGLTYKQIKPKIPNWLIIINHDKFKVNKNDVRHHAFYVAPIDVGQWDENSFYCYSPNHCGISLSVYGYFPCVLCGGIKRTFQLEVEAIHSLKDVNYKNINKNLYDFCKLCGNYLNPRNGRNILSYDKKFISESWKNAFKKLKEGEPINE